MDAGSNKWLIGWMHCASDFIAFPNAKIVATNLHLFASLRVHRILVMVDTIAGTSHLIIATFTASFTTRHATIA
jgi:hypothetical protein